MMKIKATDIAAIATLWAGIMMDQGHFYTAASLALIACGAVFGWFITRDGQ